MRLNEIAILLEYKREVTASKMGKRILQSLPKDAIFANKVKELSDDKKIDAVLDSLEKMDPTKNKQFVQWLVKNYGLFRIEDSGRVKDALEKFVSLKTQISRRDKSVDINSYNWSTFQDMIDEMTDVDISDGGTSGDYKNKDDIKILYNGPYGKLLIPKTEEASCEIGSGTRWCTASTNNNMFSYYVEREFPDSNLYVWIDKNSNKYQFHFESSQYMNAADEEIDDKTMKYFINDHPVLSKFFKKFESKDLTLMIKYIDNPDKELQLAAVKQNGLVIKLIEHPDKDVQLAAVKEDGYAIKLIEHPDKDVQMLAVKDNGISIRFIDNPDKDVQLAAVNENGISIRFIDNPDKDVQLAAVKEDGYAIEYIKNPDKDVIDYINRNKKS